LLNAEILKVFFVDIMTTLSAASPLPEKVSITPSEEVSNHFSN
jgi:hypothetical protein